MSDEAPVPVIPEAPVVPGAPVGPGAPVIPEAPVVPANAGISGPADSVIPANAGISGPAAEQSTGAAIPSALVARPAPVIPANAGISEQGLDPLGQRSGGLGGLRDPGVRRDDGDLRRDDVSGAGLRDPGVRRDDGDVRRDDVTPVLTARNVSITYEVNPPVEAVREVSLTLNRGEILGLAGESGCGKTTFAYGINRLLKAPAVMTAGEVTFHDADGTDVDVVAMPSEALRRYRWSKVSMVFQGSMNSLNPVLTVRTQLNDVFTTHRRGMSRRARNERAAELLSLVGVDPNRLSAYPHELSGGMRQRVMIAMALALEPQVMIMDEPTTALDVLVQRGIIRQLMRLRERLGFAVIFITHDLPLLIEISDRIAIMRAGRIVEQGTAEQIYRTPEHQYTKQLLSSFPSLTGARGGFVRGAGSGGTTSPEASAVVPAASPVVLAAASVIPAAPSVIPADAGISAAGTGIPGQARDDGFPARLEEE